MWVSRNKNFALRVGTFVVVKIESSSCDFRCFFFFFTSSSRDLPLHGFLVVVCVEVSRVNVPLVLSFSRSLKRTKHGTFVLFLPRSSGTEKTHKKFAYMFGVERGAFGTIRLIGITTFVNRSKIETCFSLDKFTKITSVENLWALEALKLTTLLFRTF